MARIASRAGRGVNPVALREIDFSKFEAPLKKPLTLPQREAIAAAIFKYGEAAALQPFAGKPGLIKKRLETSCHKN